MVNPYNSKNSSHKLWFFLGFFSLKKVHALSSVLLFPFPIFAMREQVEEILVQYGKIKQR